MSDDDTTRRPTPQSTAPPFQPPFPPAVPPAVPHAGTPTTTDPRGAGRLWSVRKLAATAVTAVALSGIGGAALAATSDGGTSGGPGGPGGPGRHGGFTGPPGTVTGQQPGQQVAPSAGPGQPSPAGTGQRSRRTT
jgi:hypothetical protein